MVVQYRNRTPLHDAAQNRSCGMAELLLGAGADMNAQTLVSGSVLHSSRLMVWLVRVARRLYVLHRAKRPQR